MLQRIETKRLLLRPLIQKDTLVHKRFGNVLWEEALFNLIEMNGEKMVWDMTENRCQSALMILKC